MPRLMEKTINSGSKHTGKLTGGMSFELNPITAITDTSTVSPNFTAIGTNAGASQLSYSLLPSLVDPYFDIFNSGSPVLPQTITEFQRLRYSKGVFISRLTLRWGFNFIDVDEDPPDGGFSIMGRIRRTRNGVTDTVTNGLAQSTAETKPNSIQGTTIVDLAPRDLYWIEIAAIDVARNIVITSAQLGFEE